MPIPFFAPAIAVLAGAVLSEELADDLPRWTIDIPDGAFDRVNGERVRGYLVIDFLDRRIRGIAWVTPFPADRTDWVLEVGRLMATDVLDWVRDRVDLLEQCRSEVLEGGGEDERYSFEESLESANYGPIRVMQTTEELLEDLSSNMGLQEVLFVLKSKGIRRFIDDHGDTTYVTGTHGEQVDTVRSWTRSKLEDALGQRVHGLPEGEILSISEEELELPALLGEPCVGFDVVFDDEDEEQEEVASEWSLERVQRSDGRLVWRYFIRER